MMPNFAWRLFPVWALTVRQFTGGKAVRVVAGLSAIPIIFALIYLINTSAATPREVVIDVIFKGVYVSTLLPITVLILATAAFGNEIDDRTLPYLTLKPVSRLRIVVEKLLGTVAVVTPIICIAMTITFALAFRGVWRDNTDVLAAMLAASVAGVVAYAAIFQFISLIISRALLTGITYSLLWESLLARYIPGIRYVSIRHYTNSIFANVLNDPMYPMKHAIGTQASVVTIAVATVLAVMVATWRLRRMNQE